MESTTYTLADTQKIANQIRKQILGIAIQSGGCYLAQACSSAEIIAALYTQILNLVSIVFIRQQWCFFCNIADY